MLRAPLYPRLGSEVFAFNATGSSSKNEDELHFQMKRKHVFLALSVTLSALPPSRTVGGWFMMDGKRQGSSRHAFSSPNTIQV